MATTVEIIVKAVDRSSKVVQGVGTSGREAGTRIKKGMDNARTAAGKLDSRMRDVAQTMAGIDATKSLGSNLFGSIDNSTASVGQLQAQLGVTKEEAEGFGQIARDVYGNNFAGDLGEATSTVGLLHQALGLTGGELQDATEDVFRITDAFGEMGAEPGVIAENVRTMKAAFPDMTEAQILDSIAKGFQSGAGTAGDFQDTLQEYPGYFSDIGLSAQDMNNFLGEGMKSGARNTDLLGDAVKEFGILAKEEGSSAQERLGSMFGDAEAGKLIDNFGRGGDAGRDAFFTMMEGLSKIEDPLERNAAAVDLFGTMGEDLGGSLHEMIPAFLATKDATDDAAGATESLDAQYGTLGGKLEGAKRMLEMNLTKPLGGIAGPASAAIGAMGGLGTAALGLQGLGVDLAGSLGKVPGTIMKMVPAFLAWTAQTWASVAAHVAAAVAWMSAYAPVLAIIGAVILVVAALYLAWQSNFLGIQDITFSVWEAIKGAIQAAVNYIGPIIQNWINNLKVIWEAFWPVLLLVLQTAWEGIKLYFETTFLILQTLFTTALGIIKTVWDTMWPLLKAVIDTVWPPIRTAIETAIGAIKTVIETTVGAIKTFWETVWPAVRDFVQPIWDAIKAIIETVLGAVKTFIEGDLGAIRSTWETIWNAVRDFVQPIWDAIKAVVETVFGAVKSFIETTTEAVKTVWETIWNAIRDFVGPIWDTIKSTVETVFGAIKSFIETTIGAVKSTWETIWGTIREVADTIWGEIQGIVETVFGTIKGVVETVIGEIKGIWETVWGEIKDIADTLWGEMEDLVDTSINAVETVIDTITGNIKTAWETVWGGIKDFLSDIWDGAGGIYNTVKGSIESVKTFIGGIMGDIETAWDTAWGNVKSTVTGIWEEIGRAVTTGVNEVIGAINGFITAFNGISITIPSIDIPSADIPGIGKVGGGSLGGFTVSMPQVPTIPTLNTGGMLSGDSLFYGHKGEHVINPNDSRNINSLAKALKQAGAGSGGTTVPVNFYGPVTINARDQQEAERSAGHIGYGVVAQLRKRGRR